MITGRWGRPGEVLLDLTVDEDGSVRGIANPGRQNAPIRRGHFDADSGNVDLEGEYLRPDGTSVAFKVAGRLEGRTLRLTYEFGEMRGEVETGRVEDFVPRPLTLLDRMKPGIARLRRWLVARTRPHGETNARRLRARGESLDSIVCRDAVAADIPALAELHVTTWNATYNTSRGPTIAMRAQLSNPTLGFYDRMGGERLRDDRGQFIGAYAWRDVERLLP